MIFWYFHSCCSSYTAILYTVWNVNQVSM